MAIQWRIVRDRRLKISPTSATEYRRGSTREGVAGAVMPALAMRVSATVLPCGVLRAGRTV